MNKQEFSGKTLDEAIEQAAQMFGIDRSIVKYSVLPPSKGGLFSKLFSRSVRIEAWHDSSDKVTDDALQAVKEIINSKPMVEKNKEKKLPRKPEKNEPSFQEKKKKNLPVKTLKDAPASEKKHPPRNKNRAAHKTEYSSTGANGESESKTIPPNSLSLDAPEVTNVFEEFRKAFFNSFSIDDTSCSQNKDKAGNLQLTVNDTFLEEILSRSDKLSMAFEHIFKRLAQKKVGDVSGRVFLSAGNSDKNREEKLKSYAFSLAEKVQKTGRSITISSKTSQERRIIHLALDGFPGIATKSVGSGEKRQLIIFSTARRKASGHGAAPRAQQQNQESR